MARGELMKKLLASYGRDDEFRAVAEQIILEEEQKNNRVLARTLRKTLDNAQAAPAPGAGHERRLARKPTRRRRPRHAPLWSSR